MDSTQFVFQKPCRCCNQDEPPSHTSSGPRALFTDVAKEEDSSQKTFCCRCYSSFHLDCVGLQEALPKWFCDDCETIRAQGYSQTKTVVPTAVNQLYSLIKKSTGQVGGYGHSGAVYGEVTKSSFQRIVDYLVDECDLNSESAFIDIGAGLGKPSLHVAVYPRVKYSFGIELESLRWKLSLHNLANVLPSLGQIKDAEDSPIGPSVTTPTPTTTPTTTTPTPPSVFFSHTDLTSLSSLNPFTHIYTFDTGFPPAAIQALCDTFRASHTATHLICFHKPRRMIAEFGLYADMVRAISTSMCGSGEHHTAYVYRKCAPVVVPFSLPESPVSSDSDITVLDADTPDGVSKKVANAGGRTLRSTRSRGDTLFNMFKSQKARDATTRAGKSKVAKGTKGKPTVLKDPAETTLVEEVFQRGIQVSSGPNYQEWLATQLQLHMYTDRCRRSCTVKTITTNKKRKSPGRKTKTTGKGKRKNAKGNLKGRVKSTKRKAFMSQTTTPVKRQTLIRL